MLEKEAAKREEERVEGSERQNRITKNDIDEGHYAWFLESHEEINHSSVFLSKLLRVSL